jgi:hypothetical protein
VAAAVASSNLPSAASGALGFGFRLIQWVAPADINTFQILQRRMKALNAA